MMDIPKSADTSPARLLGPLSAPGMLTGAFFFLAALAPSLIPRDGVVQGVLAGLGLASGYALGVAGAALWHWLSFREMTGTVKRRVTLAVYAVALLILAFGLFRATDWQNTVHSAIGIAPVETARPFTILAVASLVAAILLLLGRLFGKLSARVARFFARFLPPRLAAVTGIALAGIIFWSVGNEVVVRGLLGALDKVYVGIDRVLPPEAAAPSDPLKSGSSASLVPWESLGAEGRNRVLAAPDAAVIAAVSQRPAKEPLRVYVGLGSAETPEDRAALALREMLRTGAFDRTVLVIATPTGTGWIDPAGMAPAEFLAGGDIASVSVQYSYLPSWLSLLVEPEYGDETAKAVFHAVYGHWRSLPRDRRPLLYLFGLSLGSVNSDLSADLYDIVADPYQGAVWAGPPFASRTWPSVTRAGVRAAGTPVWSPRFRDGSVIRFTTQTNTLDQADAPWGPIRIVYLQYASDPIVFFRTDMLWRKPEWYDEPRGPDVSPGLAWVPVVSFLQVIFDMMTATTTPTGTGHVYAGAHYLDAWVAVTDAPGWDAAGLARINGWLADQGL